MNVSTKTYIVKPPVIQAMQFWPKNFEGKDRELAPGETVYPFGIIKDSDDRYLIKSPIGLQIFNPGDYVIIDQAGNTVAMSPDRFHSSYQEVR